MTSPAEVPAQRTYPLIRQRDIKIEVKVDNKQHTAIQKKCCVIPCLFAAQKVELIISDTDLIWTGFQVL
jgi:hypothetical protein